MRCGTPLEARYQEDRDRPTCPICGFILYLDPKVAVAVLIHANGRALLGKRAMDPARGEWSFPAGYVNRGEVLEEAAAREVREEFGVDVRVEGLVGVYSHADDPVILVAYAGSMLGESVRVDGHEISEARWFPLTDLPPLAFPHDSVVVEDWKQRHLVSAAHQ